MINGFLLFSIIMFIIIFGVAVLFILKVMHDKGELKGLYSKKDEMKDITVNGETKKEEVKQTPKSNKCEYCGSELKQGEKFCPNCGAKVE